MCGLKIIVKNKKIENVKKTRKFWPHVGLKRNIVIYCYDLSKLFPPRVRKNNFNFKISKMVYNCVFA